MAVDNGAWDGAAVMSAGAASDDPAAFYRAVCAGRREGDPALQSSWALPHHTAPGEGPNAAGCRNAMSRFPQTEGLTNEAAARSHLEAHMAEIRDAMMGGRSDESFSLEVDGPVEVRNALEREVDARIVPWDFAIDTVQGREQFARGAFDEATPDDIFLMGLEHEAHIGLGQDMRPVLTRHPMGKAIALRNEADGQHATFRVAKTASGDEFLALAADGIVRGVSVEFGELPGGTVTRTVGGRRTRVHQRSRLLAVSPTYRPAYPGAQILAVRSEDETEQEQSPVAETTPEVAVAAAPAIDLSPITSSLASIQARMDERFAALEEKSRANFTIPAQPAIETPKPDRGDWMQAVLKMLSGERIPDAQMRTIEDLVTSDNIGVVPPTYSSEIIGVINRRRPFMETTRRLGTPSSGMSLVVPRIVTRPTVAQQMTEKAELDSTATEIDTVTFDAVTKGGAGDISLQLLKRSSPSFLSLYLDLLAEAYAIESEVEAVAALLASGSGSNVVNDAGTFDVDNPAFGDAWANGYLAMYGGPDTLWLSSAAVSAFLDAKANTSNLPLYGNLQASFTVPGGVGGNVYGLRPVHVPALNSTGVD
ncbi:MAG TPA: phage major capsid protein, partial [Candidatus Limnocylindrales bacterium]